MKSLAKVWLTRPNDAEQRLYVVRWVRADATEARFVVRFRRWDDSKWVVVSVWVKSERVWIHAVNVLYEEFIRDATAEDIRESEVPVREVDLLKVKEIT